MLFWFTRLNVKVSRNYLIKPQSCQHIETSQLICFANQLTGFYMMATLAFNDLRIYSVFKETFLIIKSMEWNTQECAILSGKQIFVYGMIHQYNASCPYHCVRYTRMRVFLIPVFSRIRTKFLYRKTRIKENPYSGIFHTIYVPEFRPQILIYWPVKTLILEYFVWQSLRKLRKWHQISR